jgi:subtilisin family serine protease
MNIVRNEHMKRWTHLSALAFLLIGTALAAWGGELSSRERAKIHPVFQSLLGRTYPEFAGAGGSDVRLARVVAPAVETMYHAIVYVTDPSVVRSAGAVVNSVYPGFVTAQLTAAQILALARLNGVSYVDPGSVSHPTNDVSVPETGAGLLHAGYLNSTQYRGKGAIILLYDTGIDWKHLDFRSPADPTKSRVLSIWDQTLTPVAGETSPSGFPYGVEYTQAQINAELGSSPPGVVRERDTFGHGTHVAGTAAGNGLAHPNAYTGMAPDADIIIVKGGNGTFNEPKIIDGLTYAHNKAVAFGEPVVVNMSLGGQDGPHDGTLPEEVAVTSFTATAGQVVCIAAGNDGGNLIHVTGSAGATSTFTFTVPAYTPGPSGSNQIIFDLWLNGAPQVGASATSPDGYTATAAYVAGGSQGDGNNSADGVFTVYNKPSSNGARNVRLEVSDNGVNFPKSGTWTLSVTNPGAAVKYDGWLAANQVGSGVVTIAGGDVNETVASPGTASGAITVGCYVTRWTWPSYTGPNYLYTGTDRTSNISDFSSIGPTRDGRQKPDLAAPGQGIASALSGSYVPVGDDSVWIAPDKKHRIDQGTSMSTPHVTGAAALILGAYPTTTAAEVKSLLTSSATSDQSTGSVPNAVWGSGKLDVLEAMAKKGSASAVVTRTVLSYDGTGSIGTVQLNGTTKYAVRFSATTSGQVTAVTVTLSTVVARAIRGTGNLVCEIYNDNSGVPGSRIGAAVNWPIQRLIEGTPDGVLMVPAAASVTNGSVFYAVLSMASVTDTLILRTENVSGGTHSLSFNGISWSSVGINYRIRAVVTSGVSNATPPTVTTDPATAVDSLRGTLHGTINPNGSAAIAWFELGTDPALASSFATAQQNVPSGSSPVAVLQADTSLVPGTLYYFRLAAQNAAGLFRGAIRNFTTKTRTLPAYPASYILKDTVQFPSRAQASDFSAADYRLVGLPGNSTVLAGTLFTGTSEKDWRLSWDNGNATSYIDRYDGSALFMFSTGKAFWVLNRGPWTVSTTVPTAPLNASQQVEVPLHAGWNLITDPFNAPLSWGTVQTINGIADPLYSYAGTFSMSAAFAPYAGYYYYNTPNASLLKVPYAAAVFGTSSPAAADPATWRVGIAATSGGRTDSSASFGVAPSSQLSQRTLNFHKPRGTDAVISTSFSRPEWDPKFPDYATDIRQESGTMQQWSFDLRAAAGQSATLRFSGIRRVPASLEVWLIDEQDAASFDLRIDSVYVMTPAAPLCRFSVVVGGHEAVADLIAGARPREFALGQNYPNPFNPSTTIPVSLPRDADASLRIYDILGREVLTLYAGRLEAGRHYFLWNGMDGGGRAVSSGLYIARFQLLNGPALTSKLLLMK